MAVLKNYHTNIARLEPKLQTQACKIASELVRRKLYPEHVAVPLAVNAVKNWSRNGWI